MRRGPLLMPFTCQHLPEMDDVSEDFIERTFDQKTLGGFAQLSISDEVFLQGGSRGRPSNCAPPDDPLVGELWSFIQKTGYGLHSQLSFSHSLFQSVHRLSQRRVRTTRPVPQRGAWRNRDSMRHFLTQEGIGLLRPFRSASPESSRSELKQSIDHADWTIPKRRNSNWLVSAKSNASSTASPSKSRCSCRRLK
jgi:hypothetical protein